MTSPKTYLPLAAESLLNAYPGSFRKWHACRIWYVAEELFFKQSMAPKYIGENSTNSTWKGTNQVLGSLVCLTAGSRQSPQFYNPQNISEKPHSSQSPLQVISTSTICPRRGGKAERDTSPFQRERADT